MGVVYEGTRWRNPTSCATWHLPYTEHAHTTKTSSMHPAPMLPPLTLKIARGNATAWKRSLGSNIIFQLLFRSAIHVAAWRAQGEPWFATQYCVLCSNWAPLALPNSGWRCNFHCLGEACCMTNRCRKLGGQRPRGKVYPGYLEKCRMKE